MNRLRGRVVLALFTVLFILTTVTAQAQFTDSRAAGKAVQDYDWMKNTYCKTLNPGLQKECEDQAKKNFVRACFKNLDYKLGVDISEFELDFDACWKSAQNLLVGPLGEALVQTGKMIQIPIQPPSETIGQEIAEQVGTAVGETASSGSVDEQPSTLTRCVRAVGDFFKGCLGGKATPSARPSGTPDTRTPEQKKAEEEWVKRLSERLKGQSAGQRSHSGVCIPPAVEAAGDLCPTVRRKTLIDVLSLALETPVQTPATTSPAPVSLAPHKLSACFQSAVNTFNAAVKAGKGLDAAGAEAQAVIEKQCPDLDFTGLDLSPQAVKCKDDYVACTAAAKESATCKRPLLLCIATTPEAKAYKLQTLEMNIKVDRAEVLKSGSQGVSTKDAAGRDIGTLKMKAENGKLKEAAWESKPIGVDFTEVAPDVGKGEVKVNLNLKDLPESAQLKFNAKRDDEVKKALDAEVAQKNLKVLGVAFSVDVQTDMPVKDAAFEIKCNKAWADKHGTSKVKVIRQSGGATEVLETKFKGYAGDLAIFETTSPGLSVFSLAAVEPAAQAPPAKSPGFEAILGLSALGAAFVLSRRGRES